MNIGPLEIGLVVLAIVLLFGAKKLPELGRGLGSGMREFKEGVSSSGDSKGSADHQLPQGDDAPPVQPPREQAPAERAPEQHQPPRDAG